MSKHEMRLEIARLHRQVAELTEEVVEVRAANEGLMALLEIRDKEFEPKVAHIKEVEL